MYCLSCSITIKNEDLFCLIYFEKSAVAAVHQMVREHVIPHVTHLTQINLVPMIQK